jgi:Skp family chaperone for outer membrane proteins
MAAKREAMDTIKSYELEQKDKLDAEKEKVNASRNNFEQMDSEYNSQVAAIQQDHKQNKDKVIDFLLDNILNVGIELPENIKKGTLTD